MLGTFYAVIYILFTKTKKKKKKKVCAQFTGGKMDVLKAIKQSSCVK